MAGSVNTQPTEMSMENLPFLP